MPCKKGKKKVTFGATPHHKPTGKGKRVPKGFSYSFFSRTPTRETPLKSADKFEECHRG